MTKEKVRVYELARELNLQSKDLLDLCRAHGIDVKNQLSSIEPEMRDQIEQLVKRGPSTQGKAPAAPVLPTKQKEIRVLDPRVRPTEAPRPVPPAPAPTPPAVAPAPAAVEPAVPTPAAPPAPAAVPPTPAAPAAQAPPPVAPPPAPAPSPAQPQAEAPRPAPTPAAPAPTPTPAQAPAAAAPPPAPPAPPAPPPAQTPPTAAASATPPPRQPAPPPPAAPRVPSPMSPRSEVRNLNTPRDGGTRTPRRPGPGTRIVPKPVVQQPLKPPPPPKKKPGEAPVAKPLATFTPEQLQEAQRRQLKPEDLLRSKAPVAESTGAVTTEIEEEEEKGKGRKGGSGKTAAGPGGVAGREKRHQERNRRATERKKRAEAGGRVGLLISDEEETERRRKQLRPKGKKAGHVIAPRPKGRVAISLPITVRVLSETIGVKSGELLMKLKSQGVSPTPHINSTLDVPVAELLALDYGIELDVKKPLDAEEQMLAELEKPDAPESLQPRAPIVTVMGHVDHGKTSLLDRIRQQYGIKSDVVSTEAGGITQVIRAWRVEKDGKPVTFLDTPGHEAFTKMRARGAQVTDVAVIVVAADDGVMPQTEEAISHAKAAGVSLVVAINKVDLPSANINKTRQQLYSLNVLPDNMGGDTPFIETSAATGKGIDELLESISLVAELKELEANPDKPAVGTCLEAMLSEGEGVLATLLVQEGTIRRSDVILCGATYGRVRQMYNDQGQPIQEAGPSMPVRITGLDEIPNADDHFQVLSDLTTAREIATKRKAKQLETALTRRSPLTLEQLTEAKIAELKVILKADFRGSIEAIRKELEKLKHEEVRVRVLEAAIGGITENDVWLALTSPQDTLIVGFNVVPDDRARALAEEKGVKILQYDIIYNLTKDIRAALEGKLKPREEVVHLGRAVVRETFKISRVGTIAGCYVTQGTIERSAKVRLIREGVVIYPPPDRTASLDSLKRFKDDVRDVREGFECGIKIAGYDDVKVGDVIEAYRVEEVKRTL